MALLYLIPYPFLKIFTFSLRRARAARGPYFLLLQKVGKDRPKRAAPPLGFPLRSRWRGLRPQFARGNSGTPRRFAAGASAQICEGVAAKAVSNAVPCAGAHDRQTFPFGEPWGARGRQPPTGAHDRQTSPFGNIGGKGAPAPTPKRWRCGGRGERAGARGFPQRHRSSSRASGEEFGQIYRASEDLGVSKGGRPAPHFGPGIRKGVKLPCACLCLLSAGAESRGPRAA